MNILCPNKWGINNYNIFLMFVSPEKLKMYIGPSYSQILVIYIMYIIC